MNRSKHEVSRPSFVTDLINSKETGFFANPTIKLEITNERVTGKVFPREEILRVIFGDESASGSPEAQAVLKYPIAEYKAFVKFNYGPADFVDPAKIGEIPFLQGLHKEILEAIHTDRMDVVVLTTASDPRAARPYFRQINLNEIRMAFEQRSFADTALKAWRNRRDVWSFRGITYTSHGHNTENQGFVMGSLPAKDYQPKAGGHKGRGLLIAIPVGVYDALLYTYISMRLDLDEEQTVTIRVRENDQDQDVTAKAIVKVEAPHSHWLHGVSAPYKIPQGPRPQPQQPNIAAEAPVEEVAVTAAALQDIEDEPPMDDEGDIDPSEMENDPEDVAADDEEVPEASNGSGEHPSESTETSATN